TRAGVIVKPEEGSWQVTHARPLVPRLWKNGLLVSILPFLANVRDTPPSFGKPRMFGTSVCARARLLTNRMVLVAMVLRLCFILEVARFRAPASGEVWSVRRRRGFSQYEHSTLVCPSPCPTDR